MQDSNNNPSMLDGPGSFADFGNPKWVAEMRRQAKAAGAKLAEQSEEAAPTELSARARKKKRIYKRKRVEKAPEA